MTATIEATKKQTFTAYAELKSIISLPIEASSAQEAQEIAQHLLYDFFIQNIQMDINRLDGSTINPRVCDWDIIVEDVIED